MVEKKFFVAGVQHHQYKEVLEDLTEIEFLDLLPEPENKYDPNAIRIMFNEYMIGYVPKKFSAEVSAMMELGKVECEITKFDPNAKPWEMIEVTVRTVESEDYESDIDDYEPLDEEE